MERWPSRVVSSRCLSLHLWCPCLYLLLAPLASHSDSLDFLFSLFLYLHLSLFLPCLRHPFLPFCALLPLSQNDLSHVAKNIRKLNPGKNLTSALTHSQRSNAEGQDPLFCRSESCNHNLNGGSPKGGHLPQVKQGLGQRRIPQHGEHGLRTTSPAGLRKLTGRQSMSREFLKFVSLTAECAPAGVTSHGLGWWAEKFRLSPLLHNHKRCQACQATTMHEVKLAKGKFFHK